MAAGSTLAVTFIAAAAAAAAAVLITRWVDRRRLHRAYLEIEMVLDSFRNSSVHDAAGVDTLCEVSRRDIDRIKRQLKRIDSMMRIMEEASHLEKEETRAVVTDIAHQLKTPVAVMKLSAELFEDDSLTGAEKREFMTRFDESIDELENLVNSFLQISRMETGLIELHCAQTPLDVTIRKAVSCIIGKAEEKHISIELDDTEGETSRNVLHDSKWLAEAIINVIDNSIKYSPQDSTVVIRVQQRNGFVRMEIEDEVIGIPKYEYNKVMTRFYRGRSETVAGQKGSGVGLYLVNKIVKMHGGIVTIREGHSGSRQYPGTMIVIQIPC